ncbi:putative leucine-rich repeat-containing, plant-type, leucine-rich repeat domain, L [Rosa chinensis]|uniref:Putative leucine-rich repeat-containing, plant-type, leucine-rich repeat domain, L n=1 Tax=Rosa chinensis TaxID=74649 RepID=A0A2P6RD49_ROSCH|nr:putative leucine-rich repeat-containing, plant-type, leucine-rich repeat domain, L [Rosa chinensis]
MPTLFLRFFLFLFTTTVSNLIPAVHSNCIEAQQQSLLHFKQSLEFNSSESSKLITWNSSTDCCSWHGVTCSTNGHVVGLDLSSESIFCSIDNSSNLFQLQHLQSLNLADNNFNDSSIPSAIGKLANLRYLNLSGAYFSGQIPIEVARLKRLVVLDLSMHHYSWKVLDLEKSKFGTAIQYLTDLTALKLENPNLGTLIQNLTELTELNLESVKISGQGSDWCEAISSSLPNLRVLSLSYCGLSGPICESLAKLQSLYEIDLSYNSFYAPVPRFFANFPNLTYLSLSYSYLLGTFPQEIFQIPSLQTIGLSGNGVLHGSFPKFPNNGSLRYLIVDGTSFSGDLPNSIGNLKMLSSVYLLECNFTGSVPKSIENLTLLADLDMSGNRFNSPISSIHWETLVNLERLDLSNNQLYGTIPSSVVSLPKLEIVRLSHNRFSVIEAPLPNSTSALSSLDLHSNKLQGEIPNWILSLKSLNSLDLSNNSLVTLEAPLPNSTSALSSLDLHSNKLQGIHSSYSFLQLNYLGLASNKLIRFPDFLRNQSHLTNLDLSDNQIQGQIPNWIWILDSLQKLNLSCNSLESLEAPLLNSTYVHDLSVVDLHSNQLQGHFPLFFSSRYLDYSRNNFSSSIPTNIGDFIFTRSYLSLSSNNFHGAIPKSICNASGRVLDLSNNSLSGNIPQCLTQSPQLSVIDLKRNNLSGTIPDNFLSGCELQTLDLSNNQIQGQFPKSLVNCSSLGVLNLGNNQITDTFPCFLMSLSTLRVLVLRSNKFYGSIGCPKTNGTWPMLQIINLAHNNFSGDMPRRLSLTWQAMVSNEDDSPTNLGFSDQPCRNNLFYMTDKSCLLNSFFQRGFVYYYRDAITTIIKGLELDFVKILTIFTLIDYSSNKFNGSIPEEIGELKSLYFLNLSGNTFTGNIPSSFGKMRKLQSLDLSENHLSGQIPPQLATLTFLSSLDVSYNQLTGRIPTGTQFSTFPNTSFEGNKGLWGPPLTWDTTIALPPPKFNGSSSNPNSGDEIDWNIISAEIGFTCGFGIAVGSLLFCKRWRKLYYRAMFNILFKIFPQLEHRFGNHRRHVYINQKYWRRLNG